MTKFVAIKIHYDHRELLPRELKYSTIPTLEQYNEYLSQFHDEGIGGNGFHECLNFKIPTDEPVRFYLPPTSLPSKNNVSEDFVIFSFTYKGDKQLSAHIVGVHAGASILSTDAHGISRGGDQKIEGGEPLHYHAEAPSELVTLLTPPIAYKSSEGVYTPAFQSWGYGLRYIEDSHAKNIISTALKSATKALTSATIVEKEIIHRQIEVLLRISEKYSLGIDDTFRNVGNALPQSSSLPDKEIGYLGEKYIYEREVEYVKGIGLDPKEVQWVSQSAPASPFDIRTMRLTPEGIREHFIEVKSSVNGDANVYVSSRQISFFREHELVSTFFIVRFNNERYAEEARELTLSELMAEFDFVPIKFKLAKRS